VSAFDHGLRLDAYLSKRKRERSRSEWQRLIDLGAVLVNRHPAKPALRLTEGDRVDVLATPEHVAPRPEADIPLDVVYQDRAVIVVNKPAGLVAHPAPGNESGTLVNALLARYPELQDPTGELRPGIVHRLDKDTSGLMVVGRTASAVAALQAQMKRRGAVKRYLVLVGGRIAEDHGQIDAPIARSATNRQKMAVRADGKPALTEFQVLERFGEWTLLEVRIHTGRTHQIRVHFAYIGHPVAGDGTYGRGRAPASLRRQFVHAAFLAFDSPIDGRLQEFTAPLPPDLELVLEELRGDGAR
jgi:23S rRNA pseudouridine1911/1915/1917 synthase